MKMKSNKYVKTCDKDKSTHLNIATLHVTTVHAVIITWDYTLCVVYSSGVEQT